MSGRRAGGFGASLSGRVVLVTGAARGIGAALSGELCERGARVALAGLEPAELARRAEALGPRALWVEADVRETKSLEAAVSATRERFGRIDAVVANAGVAPPGALSEVSEAELERTIDVNLLGVWRTLRAALPALAESEGYALAICSMAAAFPTPFLAHYAASKAGVEALMRSFRSEVERTMGVRAGTAYLSFVATDLVEGSLAHRSVARLHARIGRFGAPIDLSTAARALAGAIARRRRRVYVPWWLGPLLGPRSAASDALARGAARRVAELPPGLRPLSPRG